MAEKTNPRGASEALQDLGTGLERFANWIATHPLWAVGAILALLAMGGGWELVRSRAERRETAASDALDQIQNDYLAAMGAQPGDVEVPELANPETARRIRAEYVDKYRVVAESHPGTVPAALAWLEVADLQDAQGDREASFQSLQKGLAEQPGNPRLAGLVHQRIAQNYEDRGMLAEAAAEHEKAGELPGFPLRYFALSDAARCYAQTGQRDRARELLERIEGEAKDVYQLPPEQRALLRELQAPAAASQPSSPDTPDTSDKNDSVKSQPGEG